MKKIHVAWVAASLGAWTAVANAQSVTIYGRLDASVNVQHFSGTASVPSSTRKTLSSDTSLWGIRGTEDLGDGLTAYFKMESGFQLDTGAASSATKFWNRESIVGLSDSRLGAIQLGSQFAPVIWISRAIDPFFRSNNGAQLTLLQGTRGYAVQSDNAVQYISPAWNGATARVLYSAPEGGLGPNYSASLEYRSSKAFVAASFDNVKMTGASVGLPSAATVNSRTYVLGGTYDLGSAKLHLWAQNNHIDGASDVNGYMVGTTIPIGQGEIRASVSHRDAQNADATLTAVGYFYLLSKRTTAYTSLAKLENKGSAAFRLWPAGYDGSAPAAGQGVSGLQIGVRHLF